jgi:MFS transporter, DHA1 family, multidrug resistance protein
VSFGIHHNLWNIVNFNQEYMQKNTHNDSRRNNIIVILLGALSGLGPLTIDMYLPGFPSIAHDFKTEIARVGLTLTSYFFGLSLGQLLVGPMLDKYGRKKPIMIGLFVFLVAAVGCTISQNIYHLIVGRFFLAVGVCVGMAGGSSIVRDIFKGKEVARAMSLFGMIFAIAPVVAPVIGGIVVSVLGWRYVFVVLGLMTAAMLFAVKRILPETKAADSSVSLNPKNVLVGYINVIKERQFVLFTLANMVSGIGLFTFITNSPFVFIKLYGFSEAQFGWIYGANAVVLVIANQVNRIMLKKTDSVRILIAATLLASIVGVAFISGFITGYMPVALVMILVAFFWFSFGFIPANAGAMSLYPFSGNVGRASALMGSIIMLSGAFASALSSVLHDGTARPMFIIMSVCAFMSLALFITGARFVTAKQVS